MNYCELYLKQKDLTLAKQLCEVKLLGKPFKRKTKGGNVREFQKISYKHPLDGKTVEGIVPAYIIY